MKRLLFILGFMLFSMSFVLGSDITDVKGELSGVFNDGTKKIVNTMKPHMGFYTAAGNVSPADDLIFPGFSIGLGLGVDMSSTFFDVLKDPTILNSGNASLNASYFDAISKGIGLLPYPYDEITAKIGLPVIPVDIGLRLGYLPTMDLAFLAGMPSGSSLKVGMLHIGGEARYKLLDLLVGLIKVDARLAVDYDQGSVEASQAMSQPTYYNGNIVGTNNFNYGMKFAWSGVSIDPKVVAGINIPLVGSVYGGLGFNINLGNVNATMSADGTITSAVLTGPTSLGSLSVNNKADYDAFDVKVLVGGKIFFVNLALEYGFLSKDLAVTFFPVLLTF